MTRKKQKYKVVKNNRYGYLHLSPIPREKTLSKFYQNEYYKLIRKGGRAPEIRRLVNKDTKEAKSERRWICATLYKDISYVINKYAPGKRLLDIGCGAGDLLYFMKKEGFNVLGLEPSIEAASIARSKGLDVCNLSLEKFLSYYKKEKIKVFDTITLINVLEHVPDPANVINISRMILKPNGILCIRVPNDFNELQILAKNKYNKQDWWVAAPDHINYFNFASLKMFLRKLGFESVYSQGDFPMELFLLLGHDYVGKPKVGNDCHRRRINFEMSVPQKLRCSIYEALANIGAGRNCLIFARVK